MAKIAMVSPGPVLARFCEGVPEVGDGVVAEGEEVVGGLLA